jgi:chemotaxis protein methyltransferase WspC
MTAIKEFGDLLKRSIGLDASSIGISAVERAVQARQVAFDGCDRAEYWERLRAGGDELQALIEAVVVPETWFFRDPEAFNAVARVAHEQWARAPETTFRVLSVPSSTGEEPYSIAMALLDAGVPADRFRIDAVDVSARVLAWAESAIYGRNSFRGQKLAFRDRHFEATAHGHRLNDNARRQVHFQRGNVLAADFLPGVELYDAIFCRNLLIYFDRPTQNRAIGVLQRLLKANGTVFVAPSETGVLMTHDFESSKVPLAFAFRRRSVPLASPVKPRAIRPPFRVLAPASRRAPAQPSAPSREPHAAAVVADGGLTEAVRLADRGLFAEAAVCCEDHLRRHGPSAEVFHLKGLLSDSTGDTAAAASFYRKALYLDPAHYETLVHLALLVEQQGDLPAAKLLRDRARRLDLASTNESRSGR